jgi:hypothetical protein
LLNEQIIQILKNMYYSQIISSMYNKHKYIKEDFK